MNVRRTKLSKKSNRSADQAAREFAVTPLESRVLLSAAVQAVLPGFINPTVGNHVEVEDDHDDGLATDWEFGDVTDTGASGSGGTAAGAAAGIPALHSNASARVKLFLDFDGAAAMSWGSYSVTATPAFDRDGNASSFSDAEI